MSDVRNVRVSALPANVDYARRAYDRAIDWYKVAETKAQLILTVNGAFVTIAFGIISKSIGDLRTSLESVGILTWLFLTLAMFTLCGSIVAAAASLISRHNHGIGEHFARLGVDPDDEATYRAESLWYFGHLAKLRWEGVQNSLRNADENFEINALTYSLHGLAKTVLRKHRLINAGWLLTSATLLSIIAAGTTLLIHG